MIPGLALLAVDMGKAMLVWTGAAFAVAGVAYATSAPGLLGKRADGRIGAVRLILLLPYFLFTWSRWLLERLVVRDDPWDEVAPGLFVGRWPAGMSLPPGIALVVDMTAELPAAASTRACDYLCLPCLDAAVPPRRPFAALARRIAAFRGRVYVHCALGHGRSATMATAVLLCRGVAPTVGEGIRMLRRARPRVRLGARQVAFLETLESELKDSPRAAEALGRA
jgi:protein-tyrosine phosphatase